MKDRPPFWLNSLSISSCLGCHYGHVSLYYMYSICLFVFAFQACSGHVLTKIILMSENLLRKDLSGANVLILPFLSALEEILCAKNQQFKFVTLPLILAIMLHHNSVFYLILFRANTSIDSLRKASISLLLSILPLPLHFIHLNIPGKE